MPHLNHAIAASTQQLLPQKIALPTSLLGTYQLIHGIHRYWHWFRQGQIYSNPNNFMALTSGHVLDFAIGGNRYVRLAAQALWISQCVIVCVERFKGLNEAYLKWRDAIQCRYSVTVIHPWRVGTKYNWISPSSMQNLYTQMYAFEFHFRDIAGRTWKLFICIIYLSDATISATDAFYIDSTAKSHAVKHSVLYGMKCLDTIAENRAVLVNRLTQNKSVINIILANIRSPIRADQFIDYVDKATEKAESANSFITKVNKRVGGKLSNTLKYIFFGAMSAVGLGQYVPLKLVPRKGRLEDHSETKKYGRFSMVTRSKQIEVKEPIYDLNAQLSPVRPRFINVYQVLLQALAEGPEVPYDIEIPD